MIVKIFKTGLLLALLCSSTFGIELSGIVLKTNGHPIEGAYVTLLGKRLNVVTNDRGIFTFDNAGPAATKPSMQKVPASSPDIRLRRDVIEFDICKQEIVELTLYTMKGQRIQVLPSRIHAPGSYVYKLKRQNMAQGVYVLEVRIGDKIMRLRYMIAGSSSTILNGQTVDVPQTRLGKMLAVEDTLRVVMPGYTTVNQPIQSSDRKVTITLVNEVTVVSVVPRRDTLYLGDKAKFTAAILPSAGISSIPQGTLRWESSAPTVVTIDSLGEAMAIAPGDARLKVSLIVAGQESCFDLALVFVRRRSADTSFSISISSPMPGDSIDVGNTYQHFSAAITPVNYREYDCYLEWQSTQPEILKVDRSTGNCVPVDACQAQIIGRVRDYAGKLLCCDTLSMRSVWNIYERPFTDTSYVGNTVVFTAAPAVEFCKEYGYTRKWHSTDSGVLTIDSTGHATYVGLGRCQVTVDIIDSLGAVKASDTSIATADWQLVSQFKSTTYNWETIRLSYDDIGNHAYATVRDSTGGVWRSDDGGITWKRIAPKVSSGSERVFYTPVDISPVNNNVVGFLFSSYYSGGVQISIDNGNTWQSTGGTKTSFVLSQYSTSVFFSIYDWQIYKHDVSRDSVWKLGALPDLAGESPRMLRDNTNPAVLYVAAALPHVSTDTGATWKPMYLSPDSAYFVPAHVDANGRLWAYSLTGPGGNWDYNVLRSSDHGTTWESLLTPADSLGYVNIREMTTSRLNPHFCCFISNVGAYFYHTSDDGVSWQKTRVRPTMQYYSDIGSVSIIDDDPITILLSIGSALWKYREPR